MRPLYVVFLLTACRGYSFNEKETTTSSTPPSMTTSLTTTPSTTTTASTPSTTTTSTTTDTSSTTTTTPRTTTPPWSPPSPPGSYGGCIDPVYTSPGVVRCADGSYNRRDPVGASTYTGGGVGECTTVDPTYNLCDTDADCGPGGQCEASATFYGGCDCRYPCLTDSDCSPGTVCLDGRVTGGYSTCAFAWCTHDAECASGECGIGFGIDDYIEIGCREPALDDCRTSLDCDGYCIPGSGSDGFYCEIFE